MIFEKGVPEKSIYDRYSYGIAAGTGVQTVHSKL